MKKLKQSLLIAGTIMTIGAGSLGMAAVAHADTATSSTGTSLIDKLVAKFGLSKTDVQAVFDADRTEHEAARAQQVADKLAAGVKAGTITQAQSDLITAKIKELQTTRDANRTKMESMTDAERKTAMEAERAAMKTWISDNKIPEDFARLLQGGRGHGMGMGGDMAPLTTSTTN